MIKMFVKILVPIFVSKKNWKDFFVCCSSPFANVTIYLHIFVVNISKIVHIHIQCMYKRDYNEHTTFLLIETV